MDGFNPSQSDGTASNPYIAYPMQGIKFPEMNDVMLGRGGATNNHIGNIRFRQLVNDHKRRYLAAPKVDKPRVALEVVQIWRGLDPPGRFLTKTHAALGDASTWHDVGDKKAREKASQCLRERTPDVIPFVKQLEQEEKIKKMKSELAEKTASEPLAFSVGSQPPNLTSEAEVVVAALNGMGPPPPEKPKRKKKTREEFASSIPTGATLTKVAFSDDNGNDELESQDDNGSEFMEDYQRVLADLASSGVKDGPDEISSAGKPRPGLSKGVSGTSWMKSFKSIGSEFSSMEASAYTPRYALDEEEESEGDEGEGDEGAIEEEEEVVPIPLDAVRAQPTASTLPKEPARRPRLVNAQYVRDSQMSMMSDLSSRSLMMGQAAADQASRRSVLSAMSDMTELSDALKDMDLSTYGTSQR